MPYTEYVLQINLSVYVASVVLIPFIENAKKTTSRQSLPLVHVRFNVTRRAYAP